MQTVWINPEKCVGCRHCEIACTLEHSRHKDILSYVLEGKDAQPRLRIKTGVDFMPFPNRCRHCDPAPCMQVCPSGAIFRDQETAAVLVDPNKCISCWMCVMVCPFSSMDTLESQDFPGKQAAIKCDACVDRLKQGQVPACVTACKTGALEFGEQPDLLSKHKQMKVLDFTLSFKGMKQEGMPYNLSLYRSIQKRISELGPMPASSEN
ncbi:MAG TPA: 4Fe-4S dicluster domain-containing protein [Desulfohalobiaceae bacterium]|nr:4Fe-4S dicluster domain-containing protein [Desulfohalobiaceae bacterium]